MIFIQFYFIPQADAQAPPGADSAQEHLQKGTEFLFSGNWELAEKEFLIVLRLNPKLHRAHFGLGLVYLQTNKIDRAETSFREAIAIQPDYAPAFRALGQVDELKNDLAGAVVNYQRAVSLEKVDPRFANDVATARFRLSQIGDTPEGALEAKKRFQQASSLLREKKKEEAFKTFQTVLNLVPRHLEALENAAVLSSEQGRFGESAGFLNRILAIDPAILFAHFLLGVADEALGKIGEAWEEYHTTVQLGEKTPQNKHVVSAGERLGRLGPTREAAVQADQMFQEALSLFKKEEWDKAEAKYREVLKRVPAHLGARLDLGIILSRKETTEEAEKLLLDVEKKDPTLLMAHFFLGKLYFRQEEIQKGWDEMTRVLELGNQPPNSETFKMEIREAKQRLSQFGNDITRAFQIQKLLREGGELVQKEEFDSAREKFSQVLTLSPENVDALASVGTIYLRESSLEPKKAQEFLEKAVSVNPDILVPRIQLALLYESQDEYEKAIAEYHEVLQRGKKESELVSRAKKLLVQIGETPEKAKQLHFYLRNGEKRAQEKKWDETIAEYQKALEIVPNQVHALLRLALTYIEQKKPAEAEKRLKTLLETDPDHLEGRLHLGFLLGSRGEYEQGIQELEKVISIGKEGKTVQTAKNELDQLKKKAEGEVHFKAGMDLMTKLNEAEKKNPPKPGEPPAAGRKMLIENAVKELEIAERLNPENPYYLYNLGYGYVLKLDLLSAEVMFKLAVAVKPDLLIAHYRLAILYDLAGAVDAALKEYQKVVELGKPEDEEVKEAQSKIPGLKIKMAANEEAKGYALLGALFIAQNNIEKAGFFVKKAVELSPGVADYWYNLGVYYDGKSDLNQAEEAYRRAIKTLPNFSKPYFYLGIVLEKKGRYQEAYEDFKNAKKYLSSQKSPEASLIQGRLDFYEKRITGSLSMTLFNFDSNIGFSENPQSDISGGYGLDLRYFYYKSLKALLSLDLNSSTSIYYYLQAVANSSSFSLDASWPGLLGFEVFSLGSTAGANFGAGGMYGWNSLVKFDLMRKGGWFFDSLNTHFDYIYSISVLNPFYDSIRQDISWTFSKNQLRGGTFSTAIGLSHYDVVAQSDTNVSWNVSSSYSHPVIPYLTGSLNLGIGQTFFENPDAAAAQAGLGVIYRKNQSLNVSTSLTYSLYQNLTLTGSLGWQIVTSNIKISVERNPNDILNKQTNSIGLYQKQTLGFSINYSF